MINLTIFKHGMFGIKRCFDANSEHTESSILVFNEIAPLVTSLVPFTKNGIPPKDLDEDPFKIIIKSGGIRSSESDLVEPKEDLLRFRRFKNWFHQYLTLWLLVLISLVQLSVTLYTIGDNDKTNFQNLFSYTIKNGLQEDHLRLCPCRYTAPSG